jgi:hypothetical protein
LHNRRQIIASMSTKEAANKLVDEIAPKLTARNSGHLRIERTDLRRGDGTQMARISFVDDLTAKAPKKELAKAAAKPKTAAKPKLPAKETK